MKEATDENRVETADRAEISAELEDMELCMWLWDPSDDLQATGSNDTVFGGLFMVATSDFPAWLGLKARATAQHFGASGLKYFMPGLFFTASVSLGSSQLVSLGFPCLLACKPRLVC